MCRGDVFHRQIRETRRQSLDYKALFMVGLIKTARHRRPYCMIDRIYCWMSVFGNMKPNHVESQQIILSFVIYDIIQSFPRIITLQLRRFFSFPSLFFFSFFRFWTYLFCNRQYRIYFMEENRKRGNAGFRFYFESSTSKVIPHSAMKNRITSSKIYHLYLYYLKIIN